MIVRLLLHVHVQHRRGGPHPPGLVLLLEDDAQPQPGMWEGLKAFISANPPNLWDVARLHGGGAQRPLGTAALLLHSAKVVQLLHAFSFMPVGSHDKMLQHAAEQKGLRVVTSEQRLFFPARRSVDDLGEPC